MPYVFFNVHLSGGAYGTLCNLQILRLLSKNHVTIIMSVNVVNSCYPDLGGRNSLFLYSCVSMCSLLNVCWQKFNFCVRSVPKK